MSEKTTQSQRYIVRVHEPNETDGMLVFKFVEIGFSHSSPGSALDGAPQYVVVVRQQNAQPVLDWTKSPRDAGAARGEIEAEVLARMNDRAIWIDRVNALVNQLEQWANELNWSTRRVSKKLDDARIGEHRVPALLMQEDTCRILAEPVGRSAPGAEGVVDLYLMPAYDDIASLYYNGNQWNIHYMFPGTKSVATIRDVAEMPLSKETLEKVLAEMRQNAA